MSQVARHRVEPRNETRLAHAFADVGPAAHVLPRLAFGGFTAHAGAHIRVGPRLQMKLEFSVEFALKRVLPPKVEETPEDRHVRRASISARPQRLSYSSALVPR